MTLEEKIEIDKRLWDRLRRGDCMTDEKKPVFPIRLWVPRRQQPTMDGRTVAYGSGVTPFDAEYVSFEEHQALLSEIKEQNKAFRETLKLYEHIDHRPNAGSKFSAASEVLARYPAEDV